MKKWYVHNENKNTFETWFKNSNNINDDDRFFFDYFGMIFRRAWMSNFMSELANATAKKDINLFKLRGSYIVDCGCDSDGP